MDYTQLGQNIRAVRKTRAITQEVLAEACNISPVFVSQIENGVRKPSLETICTIADTLSVTVDTLLHVHTGKSYRIDDFSALFENRTDGEINFCYDISKRILENLKNGNVQAKDKY